MAVPDPQESRFWRYLSDFWCVVFFGVILLDFVKGNALTGLMGPLATVYLATLTIYAGEKEFERWYELYRGRHPGEMFVLVWSGLILGLIIADLILGKQYHIPGEVVSTYIAVLGVLVITRKSKAMHEERARDEGQRS